MDHSRGDLPNTVLGKNYPKSSGATAKEANVVFFQKWAQRYPAKEGARLSGMSPKGFQKIQAGECLPSCEKLTNWCQNDVEFAAAYAAHVGLILPGEAEYAGAFTRAVNAYVRRGE